ncbi:MAG: IS630 family transposase [Deltaproteobacteria bacterium]|nr:IS630 family transposase [Deltaproteobacteria bacterium]
MRAVRLFEHGETQSAVARRLDVSRTTAMRWAQAWEQQGREGLRAAGRAGRKPRLSEEQFQQVEEVLLGGPRGSGYATEFWTLPRVAEVIEQLTGVRYHPGHVWRVLRKLGWSRQKPTTRALERGEVAIERWVKTIWPAVEKTPRAKARQSSSSTRADSRSDPPSSARGRRGDKRRS